MDIKAGMRVKSTKPVCWEMIPAGAVGTVTEVDEADERIHVRFDNHYPDETWVCDDKDGAVKVLADRKRYRLDVISKDKATEAVYKYDAGDAVKAIMTFAGDPLVTDIMVFVADVESYSFYALGTIETEAVRQQGNSPSSPIYQIMFQRIVRIGDWMSGFLNPFDLLDTIMRAADRERLGKYMGSVEVSEGGYTWTVRGYRMEDGRINTVTITPENNNRVEDAITAAEIGLLTLEKE